MNQSFTDSDTETKPITEFIPVDSELFDVCAVRLRNGRTAHITEMIFNHRINLMSVNGHFWDDAWCYDDLSSAVKGLITWNTDTMSEPTGWKKHPATGRYRPDSNPELECIL